MVGEWGSLSGCAWPTEEGSEQSIRSATRLAPHSLASSQVRHVPILSGPVIRSASLCPLINSRDQVKRDVWEIWGGTFPVHTWFKINNFLGHWVFSSLSCTLSFICSPFLLKLRLWEISPFHPFSCCGPDHGTVQPQCSKADPGIRGMSAFLWNLPKTHFKLGVGDCVSQRFYIYTHIHTETHTHIHYLWIFLLCYGIDTLHWEVVSRPTHFSLYLESGQTFVIALTNPTGQKWCCLTSQVRSFLGLPPVSLHLFLSHRLARPWNRLACFEKAQAT